MTEKKQCALSGCDRPAVAKLTTVVPMLNLPTEVDVCQVHFDAAQQQKHKDVTMSATTRTPWGKVTQ